MTELDLGLKVGVRRLFWSMGLSTRLDVQMRGVSAPNTADRKPRSPESFTDLDVLGVGVNNAFRVSTEIADCKSGRRDASTARMFWTRGVADFFEADHAYLVREHAVSDGTRQLSARLGITVLPSPELGLMQDVSGPPLPFQGGPLDVLFDRDAVGRQLAVFTGLDARLKDLIEYCQYDYWLYEPYRNPFQLVAHLNAARKRLDPKNPIHVTLLLDAAWLYLLAMIRACEFIRGAFLKDPERGLQEYIFGGATNLKEKEETAKLLRSMNPESADDPRFSHLPSYYRQLRELAVRLLRRPAHMQTALRYAEAATALSAARLEVSVANAFGDEFDQYAAKLLADVCGYLVAAADLPTDFRGRARAFVLGEGIDPDLRGTIELTPSGGTTQVRQGRASGSQMELPAMTPPE